MRRRTKVGPFDVICIDNEGLTKTLTLGATYTVIMEVYEDDQDLKYEIEGVVSFTPYARRFELIPPEPKIDISKQFEEKVAELHKNAQHESQD